MDYWNRLSTGRRVQVRVKADVEFDQAGGPLTALERYEALKLASYQLETERENYVRAILRNASAETVEELSDALNELEAWKRRTEKLNE